VIIRNKKKIEADNQVVSLYRIDILVLID